MSETSIVQGRIKVLGLIHGTVLNTIITIFGDEEEWFYKQFVSQEQLEAFALEHNLAISKEE